MTDEEWLESLTGKGKSPKDKKLEAVRERLLARHSQSLRASRVSPEEIRKTRERIARETPPTWVVWLRATIRSLTNPSGMAIATTAVVLTVMVGRLAYLELGMNAYMQDEVEIVRGYGDDQSISPLLQRAKIAGSVIQIVDSTAQAAAEWEADLIGAGIKYKVNRLGSNVVHIHVLVERDNVDHLEEPHRRALTRTVLGEYVVILDERPIWEKGHK
jgi:hypothetical protein